MEANEKETLGNLLPFYRTLRVANVSEYFTKEADLNGIFFPHILSMLFLYSWDSVTVLKIFINWH
jgi:hypothetical protein